MISLSSILVDIDALADDQPVLGHARELAIRSEAKLKIVDVLPLVPSSARDFVTAEYEHELVEHRTERLRAWAATVPGVAATTELLRGRPATALIRDVVTAHHDVVLRSHARDLAAGPKQYGAVDMELLRSCPCPVWLLGPRSSSHAPWRLLAAINPNSDDAIEQRLNATIVDWALMLKRILGANLTLLHAWTVFGGSVLRSRLPEQEFRAYVDSARRSSEDAMAAFTAPLADRLRGVTIQLAQGEPERAISHQVDAEDIDLVVMGTVARSGIAGLVIGNTAERVLQRLRGSVVAIKPAGFASPQAPT